MAENNSSAPLKTAEGAIAKAAQLLRECAEELKQAHTKAGLGYWDESESEVKAVYDEYIDTANALLSAPQPQAVAAQAAPAAVAGPDERETFEQAFIAEKLRVMDLNEADPAVQAIRMCHLVRYGNGDYPSLEAYFAWFAWQARAALAATPALPATEDSSAGDLAEVQAEPVALQMCSELRPRTESEKAAYLAGVADGRMYAERDADTAPQAQPADALDAETVKKAARYDWIREQGMLADGPRHPHSWRCVALLADMGGELADEAIDAAMAAAQAKKED